MKIDKIVIETHTHGDTILILRNVGETLVQEEVVGGSVILSISSFSSSSSSSASSSASSFPLLPALSVLSKSSKRFLHHSINHALLNLLFSFQSSIFFFLFLHVCLFFSFFFFLRFSLSVSSIILRLWLCSFTSFFFCPLI